MHFPGSHYHQFFFLFLFKLAGTVFIFLQKKKFQIQIILTPFLHVYNIICGFIADELKVFKSVYVF